MGWLKASECRARAKVPIIALEHKIGIACDISLGVSAATHSADVTDLLALVGARTFVPLSRFLKRFLALARMDKPFNGGIGSFKLYVMIAHIYENVEGGKRTRDDKNVGLAYLLRSFFQYYGNSAHLNLATSLKVRGAVVTFDSRKLPCIRRLFRSAYNILEESLESSITRCRERHHPTSCSILARLLNARVLQIRRSKSALSCAYFNYSTDVPEESEPEKTSATPQSFDTLGIQKVKMLEDKRKYLRSSYFTYMTCSWPILLMEA